MEEISKIEIKNEGGVTVFTFKTASINDTETITTVSRTIRDFVEENKPQKVVFDFGEVKFFSSQLLGLILAVRSRLEDYNGEVVISAINPQLHRVFKITNLDKIFRFFPDKESAVKTVKRNNRL